MCGWSFGRCQVHHHRGQRHLCHPALLGVSYLEAVGAVIDLQSDTYNTPDGHSTAMRRLPSGHRAVHLWILV